MDYIYTHHRFFRKNVILKTLKVWAMFYTKRCLYFNLDENVIITILPTEGKHELVAHSKRTRSIIKLVFKRNFPLLSSPHKGHIHNCQS